MQVYLNTNVLFWLYINKLSSFSKNTLKLIENNQLITGGINALELEFLYEIGRIKANSNDVCNSLKSSVGLQLVGISTETISKAHELSWTRDVFDRITAGAAVRGAKLITKDSHILDNYDFAVW